MGGASASASANEQKRGVRVRELPRNGRGLERGVKMPFFGAGSCILFNHKMAPYTHDRHDGHHQTGLQGEPHTDILFSLDDLLVPRAPSGLPQRL